MSTLLSLPPKDRRARTLPWLVLGLGLAATLATTWFISHRVVLQERERFEDAVQLERQTIAVTLDQRQRFFENLVTCSRLTGPWEPDQLKQFVAASDWQRWSPEILEIGLVPAVEPGDEMTAPPLPLLRISRVAGRLAANVPLPGGSNTVALFRKTSQGTARVLTGEEFKTEQDDVPCTLAVAPVFYEDNGAKLRGWIYALLDADKFYRGLPPSHSRALAHARFLSTRVTVNAGKTSPGNLAAGEPGRREPGAERTNNPWLRCYGFPSFGRQWVFEFRPTPDFHATSQAHLPWLVLGIGSLISLLLAASAWTQSTSQAHIEQLNAGLEERIRERTAALAATNEQLTRALEQEKEFTRLKSTFVAMVSHEFRTPLGNIESSAELLQNYFERLTPGRREELLRSISASTRTMAEIMDAVLLLGRVDSVSYQCQMEPVDLAAFSQRLLDEVRAATNERCPLVFRPGRLPRLARADATLLRHMFTNLLSNAVKYSPAGSPVEFMASCEQGAAIFAVRDHGVGIPEADRQRLFEAFQRGSNVGDTPGTGLGLVIVKRCVDLHHGTIEIVSVDGAGTTVTIRLPVEDRDSETTLLTRSPAPTMSVGALRNLSS